ncbi:chemotaxis-specific protein-glutamate methyltransferase CheB [Skermanella sp. TT6]|uniref:Protein-glutamate methylesterase/protein-glutamine glutaminase n=1 Tax=Skermanella cutis TaxID=2775420 RepID=A0ABX7BBI0_9PROT|nr:chemotaxis-specific protein-glutamate methyltransferase CheB [Skermanella sp. TT6]QQP91747.1 chemotaxis-specific protein-glutamate methyltransferase CheB [Skermanella sp. TT6]
MIRLLIIDDSALMRKLLAGIFEQEGDFEIRTARNGAEALDLARSFAPQVATLDINMPVMDGLTCLSRLMVETPLPVVVVSSQTPEGAETTLEALALGAVDVIAKPEGTVSLSIDRIRPMLVETVRAAAGARLRPTLRLADRIRHRMSRTAAPDQPPASAPAMPPTMQRRRAGQPEPAPGLVLIGASTGGPQALETILTGFPEDLPWPVLVAQHMPASFTGAFAQRLDRICPLPVEEVRQSMPLLPGRVHVARGDADLIVARRPAGLIATPVPSSPAHRWHPSVDRMVTSALNHVPAGLLVGVLVTGMGDDGAAAMARLSAEGGHAIAQDEDTAVVWGMPGALVRLGGADTVAPLPDIARAVAGAVARAGSRRSEAPCR